MLKHFVAVLVLFFSSLLTHAQPEGNELLNWIGKPITEPAMARLVFDIEKGQHTSDFDQMLNRYEIKSFDRGLNLIFNQNFILSEIHFYDSGHLYSRYNGSLPTGLEIRMHHDYFKERFSNFDADTFNQFVYHSRYTNGKIDVYFRNRHTELIKLIGDPNYIAEQDKQMVQNWGRRIIPDGTCTEGNCYEGQGKMKWPDGLAYSGTWKYGIPHGQGTLNDSAGFTFSGELKLGFLWNEGRISIPNQYTYKGTFLLGKRYGSGEARFTNGTRYTGEWENDLMQGYGKYYFSESYHYDGYMMNNQFNGKGILYTPEGYLECAFKDGKPNGYGTQVAANKARLKGKWVNGQKEGEFDAFTPDLGEYKAVFEHDIEINRYRVE